MKLPIVSSKRVEALERQNLELQQSLIKTQVALSSLTFELDVDTGNPYDTYDEAVTELCRKYDGVSEWGNFQARTIVDVRSAFIIGNGLQVVEQDPITKKTTKERSGKYQKEMDFIEAFVQHNDLDEEAAQDFAKEAELEGRFLVRLVPDMDTKQIGLRFLSYDQFKYKVLTRADDYRIYTGVEYKIPNTGVDVRIEPDLFVYKKFAGRAHKVNDLMPKTAVVLRLIEDIDKCLKDLRRINNLFASPTPYFKCEDSSSAKDLYDRIKSINWKIGKLLVGAKTDMVMVGADAAGIESLVNEITNLCKMISGATGVPVHFLGLPDLMSNRSTSTDLFEMVVASTNRERKTWIGTYEEIFRKALALSNSVFATGFNVDVVSCDVPQITSAKLKELTEVWLPLYMQNVVDLDYMLSMIPDADSERIKKAKEAEMESTIAMMRAEADINTNSGGSGE